MTTLNQELSSARYIEFIKISKKPRVTQPNCYSQSFFDDFVAGPATEWQNELGSWGAAEAIYRASEPTAGQIPYSSLPDTLEDFILSVNIKTPNSGGVWLRTDGVSGLMLQFNDGDLVWRPVYDGDLINSVIYNRVTNIYEPGVTDLTLRVEAKGSQFRAYLGYDRNPVTLFSTTDFGSGRVALHSASAIGFGEVSLFTKSAVCSTGGGYDITRDLIDPNTVTTVKKLAQQRFLRISNYAVFFRDFSSGVLTETTVDAAVQSRTSVVFISKDLSDGELAAVAEHLYASQNILPKRQL